MRSWRDAIVNEFTPGLSRVTLAYDPDKLLLEEGVYQALNELGFEVLPYDEPIAFRFAYEARYRSRWDADEDTDKAVVIRCETADTRSLPYDLTKSAKVLSFGLSKLFPDLSYPVVTSLSHSDLDALFRAQSEVSPGRLGDNLTKDFVLRHVFGFAPELITDDVTLLRLILRRHYLKQRIPVTLEERMVSVLEEKGLFSEWPLKEMVCHRDFLISFLQERWPIFLNKLGTGAKSTIRDAGPSAVLSRPGPLDIPFAHNDVRVYVDTMFMDGWLQPVDRPPGTTLSDEWLLIGVKGENEEDQQRRLERLLGSMSDSLPGPESMHEEWLAFAQRWAQGIVLRHTLQVPKPELIGQFRELEGRVDAAFLPWIQRRFGGLHNQPATPPVMVHHIARALAQRHQAEGKKLALVVIDGLSLDQWIVLRDTLTVERQELAVHEGAVFAWIPTITSVSRQSIFAGRAPLYFPASILGTEQEPSLWGRFWAEQGIDGGQVDYIKGVGQPTGLDALEEKASHPKTVILGIVVDQVDKIMHGMMMGTAGMHNQVRQWAEEGSFIKLLNILNKYGFEVFITSDHGNIEANGCGRPTEGSLAEYSGERVRVYSDQMIRQRVGNAFVGSLEWPPLGLPPYFLPLIAPNRSGFLPTLERRVAHGGVSIEELIVPFIHIEMRSHGA